MRHTRWDHGLKVTADGEGLVGHAGAVLLRMLADWSGLTAALGPALARAGKSPLVDRGVAPPTVSLRALPGGTETIALAPLVPGSLRPPPTRC
jgi:hypothetical protein